MTIQRNKILSTIVLILMLTMVAPLFALPAANAHTPPWTIQTYAFVSAEPSTVGVGQRVFVVMWAGLLMPASDITNDVRMQNFHLNVTSPDGKTQTLGPYTPDPTETTYTTYTPTQVGTYAFVLSYPDTFYKWNYTAVTTSGQAIVWTNDTFLGSTSQTIYLTVQQQPLPDAITSYPLPTEYWTRPIEGQNTIWSDIASNWLGRLSPSITLSRFQQDGTAPNSAHIMWTKPIQDGGVVGGSNLGPAGNTFYDGGAYQNRFADPIIMYGRLFYRESFGLTANAGDSVCVDLRTGAEIWRRSDLPTMSFGYYYDGDTPNQHGVFPSGILFSSNFARAFDPATGDPIFNVTNVPSGQAVLGPTGEILRYVIANVGNTTNPNWLLEQWNSSKLWNMGPTDYTPSIPSVVDASTPNRFDWNVSIPWRTGMNPVFVLNANLNDILIGRNGTTPFWNKNITSYTMWGISLKPQSLGTLLWMKTYDQPPGNVSIEIRPEAMDFTARVFTIYEKETMKWWGYNMDTGEKQWGPVTNLRSFDYFSGSTAAAETIPDARTGSYTVAYGNMYVCNYGGILSAINMTTGIREWTYGNGGPGNTTFTGFNSPWGNEPIFVGAVADGKVYLFTNEHSPNTPMYKGALIRALDAMTGKELWTLMGWGEGGEFMAANGAVADGYYAYPDMYDMQIYTIGKGPSATTVTAPDVGVPLGSSVMIRGMVTDIAAGTKQNEQAARFPSGVPAVSDASMSAWMEYVYMQKPRPTNVTGVDVILSEHDPNGNDYVIGTATSDASGLYSIMWTPPVPGKYTVTATFAGSESYWPSSAETAIGVSLAPSASPASTATPTPTTTTPPPTATLTPTISPSIQPPPNSGISATDLYLIGIAIVVIIVVIVAAVVLRRRK